MSKLIRYPGIFFIISVLFISRASAQVDLFRDLVAWYPMSGNAKNALGTGMDCQVDHATLTSDRFGHPNSAYAFDGNLKLLTDLNTEGFNAVSFSAWIKTSMTDHYEVILQSPFAFVGYVNRFTPGHFMAALDANSLNNPTENESRTRVATGSWVFISASNDGTMTRIYFNGVLENSYAEMLATSNSQLEIGGGVGNTSTQFQGSIDDVRIYKRKLTHGEMLALYQEEDSAKIALRKILDNFSNPSNRCFEISSHNLPPNSMAIVYDISGKLILTKNLNADKTNIDLSSQKSGIYIIRIFTDAAEESRKIFLQ